MADPYQNSPLGAQFDIGQLAKTLRPKAISHSAQVWGATKGDEGNGGTQFTSARAYTSSGEPLPIWRIIIMDYLPSALQRTS